MTKYQRADGKDERMGFVWIWSWIYILFLSSKILLQKALDVLDMMFRTKATGTSKCRYYPPNSYSIFLSIKPIDML